MVAGAILPGDRIGDYAVRRFLSSGGFGAVYAVDDTKNDRVAALKILHPELCAHGDPIARLVREARALSTLRHPNVVELYDSGRLADGRAYLVTELLRGIDLEEDIERRGARSPADAIELLAPICDALAAAHASNIIHRDIKASNVFLATDTPRPRVVLLDFGLAKILEDNAQELATSRLALGSPGSMAPEQIRGGAVDPRTDVYGLGALTYHLVTARVPFADVPLASRAYMQTAGTRPRTGVSPLVDAVIARAMAPQLEDRFATAAAFLAALRAAVETSAAPEIDRTADDVGVFVELRQAGADLDAIDAAMERVEQVMRRRGFELAAERQSGMLFVAGSRDDARCRTREAVLAAVELHGGSGADLEIAILVHRGDDVRHPERWTAHCFDGVALTAAAATGLDLEVEPRADGELFVLAPRAPRVDSQAGSHTQMLALIGARTAGLVHDMRSPLHVILANVDYIFETLAPTGEPADALADIRSAAHTLKTSVDEMLDASATERHRSQPIPVCVPDLVERAVKLTDSWIRKRVSVSHADSSYVLGSRGQLVQVVTNLLVNAADAIGERGQISIRTRTEPDNVEIAVRDTGPGIPDEIADRIFEPFFTTKTPGKGTGLGLALVRDIVEEHGGSICVASSAGFGTEFTIRLPRITDAASC